MNGRLTALAPRYVRNRYKVLFYTVLLTLVSVPILSTFRFSGIFIESLLAASLVAALLPDRRVSSRPYLLVAMVIVWLAHPLTAWLGRPGLSTITLGAWALIGLVATGAALRFAMGATAVDAEHLYAALGAYLMTGIYFGLLYWIIEQLFPGTFTSPTAFSRTGAIYFSFVTLATLGYGDIVPRGDIARGIAIVEGVGGQLFLAVLVARLVSVYTKSAKK